MENNVEASNSQVTEARVDRLEKALIEQETPTREVQIVYVDKIIEVPV